MATAFEFLLSWRFPVLAAAVLATLALAAVLLRLYRAVRQAAATALRDAYVGIDVPAIAGPEDVVIVYHAYYGFFVTITPTVHYAVLSRASAQKLLNRLLWFNLTWGLLAYGVVFVPIAGTLNYLLQRKSIARQLAAAKHNQAVMQQQLPPYDPNPYAFTATIAQHVPIPAPPAAAQDPSLIVRAGGGVFLAVSSVGLLVVPIKALAEGSLELLMALPVFAIVVAASWSMLRSCATTAITTRFRDSPVGGVVLPGTPRPYIGK